MPPKEPVVVLDESSGAILKELVETLLPIVRADLIQRGLLRTAKPVVNQHEHRLLRVTSVDPGDLDAEGRFPAKLIRYQSSDNTKADLVDVWAVSGDLTTDLTVGYYHGQRWGVSAADGLPVFTVIVGDGGAPSNTIEVKEQDGAPDYTGISTLTFHQDHGFHLVQPGAGEARVEMLSASTTQTGVVDTTTQGFAGYKGFENGINLGDSSSTDAFVFFGPGIMNGIYGYGDGSSYRIMDFYVGHGNGTNPAYVQLRLDPANDVVLLEGYTDASRFGWRSLGLATNYYGQFGTDPVGNVFKGGICTTIGSGGTISGNQIITGNLTVNGNTILGNATTDLVGFWGNTGVDQPAAITTVSGTAGATYGGTEQTLINDLVTAVNDLIAALQQTGYIASP